jgi:hypothetical protein
MDDSIDDYDFFKGNIFYERKLLVNFILKIIKLINLTLPPKVLLVAGLLLFW